MGVVFSLLFLITKSLAAPIALHFVNNIFYTYYKQLGIANQNTSGVLSDLFFFFAIATVLGVYAYRKKSFQNPMQLFNR